FEVEGVYIPGVEIVGLVVVKFEDVARRGQGFALGGAVDEAHERSRRTESGDKPVVAEDKPLVGPCDGGASADRFGGDCRREWGGGNEAHFAVKLADVFAAEADGVNQRLAGLGDRFDQSLAGA